MSYFELNVHFHFYSIKILIGKGLYGRYHGLRSSWDDRFWCNLSYDRWLNITD